MLQHPLRPLLAPLLAALLALPLVGGAALAPPAGEPPAPEFRRARLDLSEWAGEYDRLMMGHPSVPENASGIGPGSHLLIRMSGSLFGCTANFIWTDGTKQYLGAAGHCFLPSNRRATHGPGADYDPAGTSVSVCVAACHFGGQLGFFRSGSLVSLGPVAYARQTQNNIDVGYDFGVVEIPASLHHLVRPAMPVFQGPTATGNVTLGALVCHYGNGVGVGEVFPTHGRVGVGYGESAFTPSWRAVLAAAPGDSGSAIQTCAQDGAGIHGLAAAGVLTHLSNGLTAGTTIGQSIHLARQAGLELELVYA